MRRLFKSVTVANDNGWLQASFGLSYDGEDYELTTHQLKADEVPRAMTDAKTASEMVAGLLNAYYNKVDVSQWDEARVRGIGQPLYEGPELPFDNSPQLF
jgi:hypothetical protein